MIVESGGQLFGVYSSKQRLNAQKTNATK